MPETSFMFFLLLKSSTKFTCTRQLRNICICFFLFSSKPLTPYDTFITAFSCEQLLPILWSGASKELQCVTWVPLQVVVAEQANILLLLCTCSDLSSLKKQKYLKALPLIGRISFVSFLSWLSFASFPFMLLFNNKKSKSDQCFFTGC